MFSYNKELLTSFAALCPSVVYSKINFDMFWPFDAMNK